MLKLLTSNLTMAPSWSRRNEVIFLWIKSRFESENVKIVKFAPAIDLSVHETSETGNYSVGQPAIYPIKTHFVDFFQILQIPRDFK